MRLPISLLLWLLVAAQALHSQVADDFSDGNLSANPAWSGETSLFAIVNGELQTAGNPASDTLYLSTPFEPGAAAEWRLYARYAEAPSTSNFIRFYLASDQADLEGPLNGYFVQAGETGSADSYDLFRQNGTTVTKLIDGIAGRAGSAIDAVIRVQRDAAGLWTLSTSQGRSGPFTVEGSVTDNTFPGGQHLGIWVRHSATRNTAYRFDDLYAGTPIVDTQPPQPLQAIAETSQQIRVRFSEALDPVSAENELNYLISDNILNPNTAALDPLDPKEVVLTIAAVLANNTPYFLTVSGVADAAGNAMPAPVQLPFSYVVPDEAAAGDVIFNELMADPTPTVGLPDAEYAELFNTSQKTLSLGGWKLSNGSTVAALPAYTLAPGAYVLLVRSADTALFQLPNELPLAVWPALTNSGDNLGLRSAAGVLIDTVDYALSWYRDPAKDDGGYSLERIDPHPTACAPRTNWTASEAAAGGTPGAQNSVFSADPETEAPKVLSARVLNPSQIEVCFNESMDLASASDPSRYVLPAFGPAASVQPADADLRCFLIGLDGALSVGLLYELQISGVSDCSGNLLAAPASVQVGLATPPAPFEVVIHELLPDFEPSRGLPEAEFVELINTTARLLDLSGCRLSDPSSEGVLGTAQLLPGEAAILCAPAAAAEFAGFGKVLPISSLPSLNNSGDSLRLLAPDGTLLDYVFYSSSWYGDAAKADGGYSLERIDASFADCNNPGNWRASQAAQGGTPGEANSVAGTFTDAQAPRIESLAVPDAATVEIRFTEPMDLALLTDPARYIVTPVLGNPLEAVPADASGSSVRLTFIPMDANQLYQLSFDGLTDCSGNLLTGIVNFGLPQPAEPGDVLINEMLFNPYTGGSDFVEIVNASAKVLDLNGMRIGEVVPNTDSVFNTDLLSAGSRLFLPNEILCLTADAAIQIQTYLPPADAGFLQLSGFPSYDDDEGECAITDAQGVILDQFAYRDDFHYPTLRDDEGVSLERISRQVPTQQADNWHSAASTVRYATPGYANSQAFEPDGAGSEVLLEPQTISPDGDGDADVLAIRYAFDFQGANARVTIYDARGRLVKTLVQNTLLSTQPGVFFWDGSDDARSKADVGMYVVLFEVTRADTGERRSYRRVAVVAARL
ncbi:MAG: lamin tail domain-containing protein [Bacteroidia bacterium]|nr:lamin tail domain-containing protein [Bacteroidia bacterium]